MQEEGRDDRSLGELFAELSRETAELVRGEVRLAEAEMTRKAYRVGKNVGFLAAGGAVAYAGLLAILAGFVIAFGRATRFWFSAFLVGGAVAGAGSYLALKGLEALRQEDVTPRETVETLKEDREWLRDQTS